MSVTLAAAAADLGPDERALAFGSPDPLAPGRRLVRKGVAAALQAIALSGRAGFYEGPASEDLIALGGGEFTAGDLRTSQAEWVAPLRLALSAANCGRHRPTRRVTSR